MRLISLFLVVCMLCPAAYGQQSGSSDAQIKKLKSRLSGMESEVKKYSELELRLKETSGALAGLNTELRSSSNRLLKVENELKLVNDEIRKIKDSKQEPAEGGGTVELEENVALLETEISFIRQELARMQEAQVVEATLKSEDDGRSSSIRERITAPEIGTLGFFVSLIALLVSMSK